VGVSHYYPQADPQPARPPVNNFLFLETLSNRQIANVADVLLSKMSVKGDKYSVILPTYNERENLPVLVQMLSDTFSKA
jgi:hypothetical protein